MKKIFYVLIFSIGNFMVSKAQSPNAGTSSNISGALSSVATNKADTTIKKDGWIKGGVINISLSQASQNTFWTSEHGGGNTAFFGLKGIIAYNFNRRKGKTNWLNSFNARYGGSSSTVLTPIPTNTTNTTSVPFSKSDDYLNFTSIYGSDLKKKYWSFAGLFSLESQFDGFLHPGYIKFGPGFLYNPNKHFNLFLSPLMANITTKISPNSLNVSEFGVDAGKKTVFALGAYARASYTGNISKGIIYTTTADLYSNYLKNPGNLVLNWNNIFAFTVNKYIAATLSFNFRYNDLEVTHLQFQQGLGLGFNYALK